MQTANFAASLPFILRWEGGLVDHPADPGGRTNKGVTQRTYDAWRARQGAPARDVELVEEAEVRAIYEVDYWRPPKCDVLARRLDLVHFDTAVNMGVQRAVRLLQTAIGCGVDGVFGPMTEQAATTCDAEATITSYCDAREAFYRRLVERRPDLGVFLRGWLNRLAALRREAGPPDLLSAGTQAVDFGETGYVARIPDLGEDPLYDDL